MGNIARQVLRTKAKAKFKEFKKEKKEYKNVRFADFYKIYKAGLLYEKSSKLPDAESFQEGLAELESIVADDDLEEEDVSTVE